ncbi:hypothetical protein QJS04_geneDACA024735 [Acorus gramineus]|uniref:MULE transposase domain-containing protein n=1 Tax=Acorus gramineus TaxID=55184 RepID=A0AAV9B9A9_ACOGR|nr:hypothetical protein QJS04_geneDACA024735 [Acorus gramineus]
MKKVNSKMASQAWICDKILDTVKSNAKKSIVDFQKDLQKQYNIKVPYHRVWTAREIAYEKIHGKMEDSYKQILDLHNELLKQNPRSVVHYKISPNHSFQRFFVCFVACSSGFFVGYRPIISVDDCHLKGKYKGVLLAVTSIDGNHGIFPIAYVVCEGESAETWTWFFECLKETIGEREASWEVARSFTRLGFEIVVERIKGVDEGAARCLTDVDAVWSRHQFGITGKCHYITNNLSESFNAFIGEPRQLPIVELIDMIRQKIMVKLDKSRRPRGRPKKKRIRDPNEFKKTENVQVWKDKEQKAGANGHSDVVVDTQSHAHVSSQKRWVQLCGHAPYRADSNISCSITDLAIGRLSMV